MHGENSLQKRTSSVSTHISQSNSNGASQLESNPLIPPSPLQTNPLSKFTQWHFNVAYKPSSRGRDTLDHSQELRSNLSWALSSRHPSALSRNQGNQENSDSSKTYRFPMSHATTSPLSTVQLTPISFHAPGEPFRWFHISSGNSLHYLKLLYGTSRKPTKPSHWHHLNGQGSLSGWAMKIPLPSTHATVSDSHRDVVVTELLEMQGHSSCERADWVQSQNGLTITSSFEFISTTFRNTTSVVEIGQQTLLKREVGSKTEAAYGLKVRQCPMVTNTSLMRTAPCPSVSSQAKPLDEETMPRIPTVWLTLTRYQMSWAFHGKKRRTFPLAPKRHLRVSRGISRRAQSEFPLTRGRNTWTPYSAGRHQQSTHWKKSRSCMESFYMLAKWFWQVELTSPILKSSWPSSVIVLSCCTPNPAPPKMTSSGGSENYRKRQSSDLSQAHVPSGTSQHSQMLARKWVSGLSSMADGEHGVSSQDGNQKEGTLAGLKQLASSSSSQPSWRSIIPKNITKSTETTKELLRDGGKAGVETHQQMKCSNLPMPSVKVPSPHSSHVTFPVNTTQQMTHREGYTEQGISFSHPSQSQPNSSGWLSTLTQKLKRSNTEMVDISDHFQNQSQHQVSERGQSPMRNLKGKQRNCSLKRKTGSFNSPQLTPHPLTIRLPPRHPSGPSCLPKTSHLQPHILARNRLQMWKPTLARNILDAEGVPTNLNQTDLAQIMDTLSGA